MTKKQTEKWVRSEDYLTRSKTGYPFGLDDESDADLEKIRILDENRIESKKRFKALQEALPSDLECQVCGSAIENADDTFGHSADHEGYWDIAFQSISESGAFNDGLEDYLTDDKKGYTAEQVKAILLKAGFSF